jgi:hypothetical protein
MPIPLDDADPLPDFPPHVVFQAILTENLMAFTEFAFGVVRPGVPFKSNWHLKPSPKNYRMWRTATYVVSSSPCRHER